MVKATKVTAVGLARATVVVNPTKDLIAIAAGTSGRTGPNDTTDMSEVKGQPNVIIVLKERADAEKDNAPKNGSPKKSLKSMRR